MIEIIPAIDVFKGKCVRLKQGDFEQMTVYSDNPVDLAVQFEQAGIRRLHLVDLEGARQKEVVHYELLRLMALKTSLKIDFGGGVRTLEDVKKIFECGAGMITVGSIPASDPDTFLQWLDVFGAEHFILGADSVSNKIAISGWSEITSIDLSDYLEKYAGLGIQQVLSTDISRDGMLQGISVDFYKSLSARFPVMKFIASGGVTNLSDIIALDNAGVYGAIIGKAFYDGKFTLDDLQPLIKKMARK
jgi:phosphoribosylformimino-5-aminoimidazole carboxamide ribotide isomerase